MLLVAFPRTPVYGGYPFGQAENFRRAKSGVLERGPVRPHWGPEREENGSCCGPTSAPEFAEPTLPARFSPEGWPHVAARKPSPLGEGGTAKP